MHIQQNSHTPNFLKQICSLMSILGNDISIGNRICIDFNNKKPLEFAKPYLLVLETNSSHQKKTK